MGISRSMDAVAAAARFVGCAIRQVTCLQTRVPHRNNSGGLDGQEEAVVVAEGHHQLAVVEEASRGSHDALVGGREWWPSTRGGQPRMAASSNRRREYEAEARPSANRYRPACMYPGCEAREPEPLSGVFCAYATCLHAHAWCVCASRGSVTQPTEWAKYARVVLATPA